MEENLKINKCHVCLKPNESLFNLFHISGYDSEENILPINEMLSFCTSLKLEEKLVSLICGKCLETVMISYSFIKQFQKNYKTLQTTEIEKKKPVVKETVNKKRKRQPEREIYKIQAKEDYRTKKSQHICPVCNKKLLTYANFEKHMKTHRQETNCLLCKEEFTNPSEFLAHYAAEHYNLCQVCQVAFDTKSQLKQHRHLPKAPNILKNNKTAMKELNNGDSLLVEPETIAQLVAENEKHQETEREKNKSDDISKYLEKDPDKHECPSCDNEFKVFAEFLRHVSTVHKTEAITCQSCIITFANTDDYLLHYDRRHYNYCELCDVAFTHRNKFIAHWRRHLKIYQEDNS